MTDLELQGYCYEWLKWCATRKYYLAPGAKNILARMQPSKAGRIPNARNDPDMQYFNMAIHTCAAMEKHRDGWKCFEFFYLLDANNVKVLVDKLKINRTTYYRRRDAFARAAYSMAGSLKAATLAMACAKPEFPLID